MDLPLLEAIVRELGEANGAALEELWITGGEPLLHSRFRQVMELIHALGHKSILVSNGFFGSKELVDLLAVRETIRRIHLSLEGLRETNDAIRGEGVFDRVVARTIPALKDAGFHVCVTIHLRRDNKDEITSLCDLLVDQLDCDLKVGIIRPIGRARTFLVDQMLTPGELYEGVKTLYALNRRYSQRRIWHDWEIFSEDIKFYIQDFTGRYSCPAGMQKIIAVTPEGDVYPCVQLRLPDARLGNIMESGSLAAVLAGGQAGRVYPLLTRSRPKCEGCRYFRRSCHGGCPAIACGLAGNLEACVEMDPYCFIGLIAE